jgi:hypothetical protein
VPAVEADADGDSRVVLYGFSGLLILGISFDFGCGLVGPPLDDESPTTSGHQLRKDAGKSFRNATESSLDSLNKLA